MDEEESPVVDFVQSMTFTYLTAVMILANAISIGLQVDYQARHWLSEPPIGFQACTVLFGGLFAVELVLRMYADGWSFLCGVWWKWNLCDLVIIGLQFQDALCTVALLASPRLSSYQHTFPNLSLFRMVRIFRLLIILRIARVLHIFGELRTLLVSIAQSLRSLFWTIFLLLAIMYIVAVYLTEVVTLHKVSHVEQVTLEQHSLEEYYGTIDRSMLALYATISDGLHWFTIMEPLVQNCSPWLSLVFCAYSAFVIFAVLNVLTGIFVETSIQTANDDRKKVLLYQMQQLFKQADTDESGTISWSEFETQLENPKMLDYLKAIDLDQEEARDLFHLLDIAESGEIVVEDLVDGCLRLHGVAKSLDLAAFVHEYKRGSRSLTEQVDRLDTNLVFLMESLQRKGHLG